MLWKCCTQYTCKFGKLRSSFQSGHRSGKGKFSFPFQRRAMPKNAQTTIQLHSFHLLVRLCSKSFKLGFSSTWTKNFQMFKLNLEKAEKPGIKLLTFVGSKRKQENSRKTSASLTTWKPLCGSQQTVENSERDGNTRLLNLRNLCVNQEATVRTGHGTTDWFKIRRGVRQGCMLSPCLFNLYAEHIMQNAGLDESQAGIKTAGRNTNNLRYADDTTLNGRKWRGIKEPLDEHERWEWKKQA